MPLSGVNDQDDGAGEDSEGGFGSDRCRAYDPATNTGGWDEEVHMGHDGISLLEAVERELVESGLPADGGINDRWVSVAVGPIPLCFPNSNVRRKAAPIHDLNHVLSGYGHDVLGEAEISAWELGGGCRNYWAAWVLGCAALVPGMLESPARVLRAFVRGRRTGNLYGADLDTVRLQPVGELRKMLGLDVEYPIRPTDVALFVGVVGVAPVVGLIPLAAAIATSPAWLAAGAHKRRRPA